MTAHKTHISRCLLALSLLSAGCASTAPNPSASHVTSFASTLGSVQAVDKPVGPQSTISNPAEGTRLFQLAVQQFEQQHTQQALQLFEQSAAADPTQPATHNNLGILYKQTGQLDKAIDAYRRAIAQQSIYPDAYYNLALAYRAKGEFNEAEQAYLKALDQNSQFTDARYNLGILYELYLGQPGKALEQYQAYLQLNGLHAKDVSTWASALERLVPKPAALSAPSTPQTPPAPAQPAHASPQTAPVTQNNQTDSSTPGGTAPPASSALPSIQPATPQGGTAP
jgi:tetratricopeptide (TPR) repeat protein